MHSESYHENKYLSNTRTAMTTLYNNSPADTNLRTLAGIICSSGAASIIDCHVFVESGITNPNSKNHSENIKWSTKYRQALQTINNNAHARNKSPKSHGIIILNHNPTPQPRVPDEHLTFKAFAFKHNALLKTKFFHAFLWWEIYFSCHCTTFQNLLGYSCYKKHICCM